jgi:glycolate oxidase
VVASGVGPQLVEYIDLISMAGITANAGIDLGIPDDVRDRALAYLVIVLEGHHESRVEEDTEAVAGLLAELGALDVYVLPDRAGQDLIVAREHAFWASKAAGADDILDTVVPRASIPAFLAEVGDLAAATGSLVVGCGHAGDGNVHLSVFQPEAETRRQLVHDILAAGVELGGAVSGEHGIGTAKLAALADLEDPVKLDLMRRIKAAFDPGGILNPGKVFAPAPTTREAARP